MVELVRVQDFVVEMALVEDVVGIVDIGMIVEDMVVGMVVDMVVGIVEDTFLEMVRLHNYIIANLVQVGFGIVVEAKPLMASEYSMNSKEDIDNSGGFVEGIVQASLVTKVSLVPYSKENISLVLLLFSILSILDSYQLHDSLYKFHTLVYRPK